MTDNKKNDQKERGYLNLKSIHAVQTSGAIAAVLRDLRSFKNQADYLSKIVSDKIKEITLQKTLQEDGKKDELSTVQNQSGAISESSEPSVDIDITNEEVKKEIKETSLKNDKVETSNPELKFEKQRTFGTPTNSGYKKDYNTQNPNYNKSHYDNRGSNQLRQPFISGQKNFGYKGQDQAQNTKSSYNRPYQSGGTSASAQSRPFVPGGSSRPFIPGGQKPFNNRPGETRPGGMNTGFVASKANKFKSFTPMDSINVLAQPERSFGNKNKNPNKNIEEKKQQQQPNKKTLFRNNILIEDDEGFSETTMGSRKLIKSKKKEQLHIAQVLESAVMTTEEISIKGLSEKTGRPVAEIIKKLLILGVMATVNSVIDFETAELVSSELGVKLEKKIEKSYEEKLKEVTKFDINQDKYAVKRPPVITVMGHVDHGKTSLLDAIRKTSVATLESGGITQHIGAYQVTQNGEKITFIDTPGHAAFTSMRERGARVTDIAILVVAADDGVMPQTKEAIKHIKAAGVPIIVAVNKMDKKDANIDRIKQQLAENEVLAEEWGGDAVIVPVSARTGEGIDNLLNMILLVAEMQNLKANSKHLATGVVLEAKLDKNKGPMATILVQNGSLKTGDFIISGLTYCKIRAMYDENGNIIKKAGPSCPVSVIGFDEVPFAGDQVAEVDEKFSKKVIEERKIKIQQDKTKSTAGVSLDNFMTRVNEGKLKALNIIIKGDVQGSVEALKQILSEMKNEEAKVVCLGSGTGAITESEVLMANVSDAIIIAFNMKPQNRVVQLADQLKVEILEYKVIYNAVDEISKRLNKMLTPIYEEIIVGHAEIRVVFKLSQQGMVAGSYVTDGKIIRNTGAKIIREGEIICNTTIDALKIMKDDKPEVNYGFECGIKLRDCNTFKEGDIIECYIKEEIKR